MSNNGHGKNASKLRDVLSYFHNPQTKNLDSLHDSNSFEQPISKRNANSSDNASNIHVTNDKWVPLVNKVR